MPSFTSSLFSNSSVGTWDYYVMSDVAPMSKALNGVASWMNGSGGVIQSAAGLGALICLALIIYNATFRQKGAGAATIGGWFFFMVSMGLTGTVNIVNVHTGATTAVANVPALALIPASIFSKAGYKVFTSMETAFQASSGSYMAVSLNGFVGPLDILLTLRSDTFPAAYPGLHRTLRQVVNDCAIPTGGLPSGTPSMNETLDILSWLKTYGTQGGMTAIYPDDNAEGTPTTVSCAAGLVHIDNKYSTFAGSTAETAKFVNTNANKANPAVAGGHWTSSAVYDSFGALIGSITGVTQSAVQFTKNALVASTVTGTIACLNNNEMMTMADTCVTSSLVTGEGRETWKTSAAMNAGGFIKTMFTSMEFMQILFFSIFPFVALYGLIVVNKTVMVFGSYILLGVWSQSWLLVVAPIQAYIQNNVIHELTRVIGFSKGLTVANQAAVYETLSTKLAVASDMMANSQMLALALLSGSIYSLSSLVGSSKESSYMDPASVQKKMTNNSPMVETTPIAKASIIPTSGNGATAALISHTGSGTLAASSGSLSTATDSSSFSRDSGGSTTGASQLSLVNSQVGGTGGKTTDAATTDKSGEYSRSAQATGDSAIISSVVSGAVKGMKRPNGKPLAPSEAAEAGALINSKRGQAISQLSAENPAFTTQLASTNPAVKEAAMLQTVGRMVDLAGDVATGVAVVGAGAAIVSSGGLATGPAVAALVAGQGAKAGFKAAAKAGISKMISSTSAKVATGATGVAVAGGVVADRVAGAAQGVADNISATGTVKETQKIGESIRTTGETFTERKSTVTGNGSTTLTKNQVDGETNSNSSGASFIQQQGTSINHDMTGTAAGLALNGTKAQALIDEEKQIRSMPGEGARIARADAAVKAILNPGGGDFPQISVQSSNGKTTTQKALEAALFNNAWRNDKGNEKGEMRNTVFNPMALNNDEPPPPPAAAPTPVALGKPGNAAVTPLPAATLVGGLGGTNPKIVPTASVSESLSNVTGQLFGGSSPAAATPAGNATAPNSTQGSGQVATGSGRGGAAAPTAAAGAPSAGNGVTDGSSKPSAANSFERVTVVGGKSPFITTGEDANAGKRLGTAVTMTPANLGSELTKLPSQKGRIDGLTTQMESQLKNASAPETLLASTEQGKALLAEKNETADDNRALIVGAAIVDNVAGLTANLVGGKVDNKTSGKALPTRPAAGNRGPTPATAPSNASSNTGASNPGYGQ